MRIQKFDYASIPQCSTIDVAYVGDYPALRPFFKYRPGLESFSEVIKDKSKEKINRKVLVEVLTEQYQQYSPAEPVFENIASLRNDNTFTVVTAHQPCLFTGPLYYIFKIVSAVNLARQLKAAYPDYNFVPVFISGGEDHDFEEINHCHLFGRTLTWESQEAGPVGRMSTASLAPVLSELKAVLGEQEQAKALYTRIATIHKAHPEYGTAACHLAHDLFKEQGLVVLNTFDARLKQLFIKEMKEEILEQVSRPLINSTIEKIIEAGYHPQATPREINFFYLGDGIRERIVWEDDRFLVLNTGINFSRMEMEAEIENHPERFSPNVVMRPLFQEKILPNLAYIGGGGELAYWLERKSQFEHFGINYPMLVRRSSAMWIDRSTARKLNKLGFSVEDIWDDTDTLIRKYLGENASVEIELNEEKKAVESIFSELADKTKQLDPSLVKTVLAEQAKVMKSLGSLEARLIRAGKQKHETAVKQIRTVKEKLFPRNGLQERHDNFIPFYLKYQEDFFRVLLDNLHPLEKKFVVVVDEDR